MLRKLELKDAPSMLECLKDKDVTKHMNVDGSKMSLSDCENYIRQSWNDNDNYHFAIVDEEDNWIGTISLKNVDNEKKEAEYAIITSSKVHGKGYAKIATKEILEFGFNVLGLANIYLNVANDNLRANKFYQKMGFLFERCDTEPTLIKGKECFLNWYYVNQELLKSRGE